MFGTSSPNPNVADPNSPKYTELSKHKNNWVTAGLIGDAKTYIGGGWDKLFSDQNLQVGTNISIGDHVLMANRIGVVTAFTTSGGFITSITVKEDMHFVPKMDNPSLDGFDANGLTRTVKYVLRPDADLEGLIVANCFLYTGILLVLKQKTQNPNSWPDVAQAAYRLNEKGLPKLHEFAVALADHCEEETPEQDITIYCEKENIDELVNGDKIYLDLTRTIKLADGVYYAGEFGPEGEEVSFYFAVENSIVVTLPTCS